MSRAWRKKHCLFENNVFFKLQLQAFFLLWVMKTNCFLLGHFGSISFFSSLWFPLLRSFSSKMNCFLFRFWLRFCWAVSCSLGDCANRSGPDGGSTICSGSYHIYVPNQPNAKNIDIPLMPYFLLLFFTFCLFCRFF